MGSPVISGLTVRVLLKSPLGYIKKAKWTWKKITPRIQGYLGVSRGGGGHSGHPRSQNQPPQKKQPNRQQPPGLKILKKFFKYFYSAVVLSLSTTPPSVLGGFFMPQYSMTTDKTTLGDLKIILAIIGAIALVWGFFRYRHQLKLTSNRQPVQVIEK